MGRANGSYRLRLKGITAATLIAEKQLSRALCAPLARATLHQMAAFWRVADGLLSCLCAYYSIEGAAEAKDAHLQHKRFKTEEAAE